MSQRILLTRLHPLRWGIALALALLLQAGVAVQAQTFEWANGGNSMSTTNLDLPNGDAEGHAIAVDCAGNSYVTGFFSGQILDGALESVGGRDVFVAKYDADGNLVWAKRGGGEGADESFGITVDSEGYSYVAAVFEEADATFGTIPLTLVGVRDMAIVKYDPDGNVLMAIHAGGTDATVEVHAVAVDEDGNIYVTGRFDLTVDFGGTSLTSNGSRDIFVAKYNAAGSLEWAKSAGNMQQDNEDFDEGKGIAVDADGNSYVTGFFCGDVDFGGTTLSSIDDTADVFIAKYDTDGNLEWVISAGGSDHDEGQGIAVDKDGNIYVSGNFVGEAEFDGITLNSVDESRDIFVAKFDTDGNIVWAKSAGGPEDDANNEDEVNDVIAIDGAGNSYITSVFFGEANFDDITLTVVEDSEPETGDVFVAKYDAEGNAVWAVNAGGPADDIGFGIGVDGSGNSYITGSFQEEITFEGEEDDITVETEAAGEDEVDFFVAKLNQAKSFVFIANKLVKIDQNEESEGDIFSNGRITFGKGAPGTHEGNLTAVEAITIAGDNTIDGDVQTGDKIYLSKISTITGDKSTHAEVEPMPWPSLSFTAGGKSVEVKAGGSKSLEPGSYSKVKVKDNGTLYLSSGDYYFNILDTEPSAVISIEISECPTNIYVVRELDIENDVKVLITGDDAATDKVTFISLQSRKIKIGEGAVVQGNVIVPNAEVHFSEGSEFRGALCADKITLEPNVAFSFHSSEVLTKKADEKVATTTEQAPVSSYELEQNYPNPFNPSTQIAFSVKEAGDMQLSIYNLNGQEVRTLISGHMESGRHAITWDGRDNVGQLVPSGIYFYKLRVNGFVQTKKMSLIK
jgi:cytoskeletal protein CcmA (bactofilin family)